MVLILAIGVWLAAQGGWRSWQRVRQVELLARQAMADLAGGGQALGRHDPVQAAATFHQASQHITQAQTSLRAVDGFHGAVISRLPLLARKYQVALNVLAAVRHLATAGQLVSQHLTPADLDQPAVTVDSGGIITGAISYLQPLARSPEDLRRVTDEALAAADSLRDLRVTDVPGAYRPAAELWARVQPLVTGPTNQIQPLVRFVMALFASPAAHEELVVFQNNDEARATGGFAGTFLVMKFFKGTFTIVDAPGNGPYALSDQVPKTDIPPQPLLTLNNSWAFQDRNWFLDAPTSAGFMLDAYEQARGFRPDGVVFISPPVMESLLAITGPLRPEHYQVDVTADNFVRATEQQVQFGYDKALNNPKQFLIDLLPALVKRIASLPARDGWRAILTMLEQGQQANLMMVSRDQAMSTAIDQLGWDGTLAQASDDYLAVVDENLSGSKTDRVTDERVHVTVTTDGVLRKHVVAVTRKHNGSLTDVLTKYTDRNFIRVYAPANAQLVSITGQSTPDPAWFNAPASGARLSAKLLAAEGSTLIDPQSQTRITHESGRTVFGAWSVIGPGQNQAITFTYTTPVNDAKQWSLVWQKQPGVTQRTWKLSFTPSSGQGITAVSRGGTVAAGHVATFSTNSDLTQGFTVKLGK